jgi:competence protein ComFC
MYYYNTMPLLKLIKNWVKKIAGFVQDLLVPEDIKIQKLLDLPAGVLRDLLPKSPVYSKDIFVLFDYQNKIVRLIVKSIKYKNNASLRKRIAGYFYEELVDISSEIALFHGAPPLLVPMPMSQNEKRKRGFNQCEELVREIKKMGSNNVEVSYDTLKKIRETERQTTLSREKRALNVKNSMAVSETDFPKIKNKVVIVLDDVYTTGASLLETRRALLASGAKRVIGLFIAH